jgi:hypothetical protein
MNNVVFGGVLWNIGTYNGNVVSFWRFTDDKKTEWVTIAKNPSFTTYFRNNVHVNFDVNFDEIYTEYVNQCQHG